MRVALVHDDLIQWGGAERVLLTLAEIFPQASIYTSIFDSTNPLLKDFKKHDVITSFLQNIPFNKELYKGLLPLYPIAFEQFDFSKFDLVISQSTRFAKAIISKPGTFHLSYCHTPPRFLWNFSGEKTKPAFKPYFNYLRDYDLVSAKRVDHFLAGSKNAQGRIKELYQVDSTLLYPPIDLERFNKVTPFNGGYLLVVARLNSYKKVDLVIQVANKYKLPLKIVGVGPQKAALEALGGETVEFLGLVDEPTLTLLLAGCLALVVAAEEDFGLTPLEAQAMGKPVIAYIKGGASETVIHGQTGYLYEEQSVTSIYDALLNLEQKGYNRKTCVANATRFSKERFKTELLKIVNNL